MISSVSANSPFRDCRRTLALQLEAHPTLGHAPEKAVRFRLDLRKNGVDEQRLHPFSPEGHPQLLVNGLLLPQTAQFPRLTTYLPLKLLDALKTPL